MSSAPKTAMMNSGLWRFGSTQRIASNQTIPSIADGSPSNNHPAFDQQPIKESPLPASSIGILLSG